MTPDPSSLSLALLGGGRMGREVAGAARSRGHSIVLVVGGDGVGPDTPAPIPRLDSPEPLVRSGARVAIDVSVAGAVEGHVRHCAAAGVDLVVGTTGWEPRREAVIRSVEESGIGLLEAPNFSLGVNLFFRIVAEAARLIEGPGREGEYDAVLHEAHHRHKVDHPGGTARRLAEIVVERLSTKERWSHELPSTGAVDPATLQVGVTRAGEIPGMHTLSFEGPDDRIELRHEARGRGGFARGAVMGAEWIRGRPGVFSMEDLLDAFDAPDASELSDLSDRPRIEHP